MFGLRSARSRAVAAGVLGLLLLAGVATTAAVDVTLWLVIGLSAGAFVMFAATLAVLIRSTVRPLAALQASARAIAAGDPEARAKVAGPEEVASLARDFNAMTDALAGKAEALRQSEARYRLLAENVADVIWAMDTNLRFTYVSPSVTRLRGYTVEEAMGQTLKEMLTPASFEVAKKAIAAEQAIEWMETKDLTRSLTLELEQTCKDGSTVWTEAKLTFLRDPDGQPTGLLGITRDITERKRAEEALRAVREDIESRVERHMQQVNGYGLTFRELAVLHLVAGGESDKEIAAVLGISPLTAHKHLANILEKMGAVSRTEAGVRALREGLLD